MSSSNISTQPDRVDVRGPRFAAWVTTAVLVVTLIISAVSPVAAAVILGLQAVVFAIGALGGPRRHPYGRVFAAVVAPRLGPVTEREPVPPLKFAQLVGLIFAVGRRCRIRRRRTTAGRHRHRGRFGGRLPERGLRHLPWLPALPARCALSADRPSRATRLTTSLEETERIPTMARSDVLVSADWAESNLDAANVVFVEVDEDTSAYDGGHIAGAIKLDWRSDLQDPVKRDFVDAQQFSKLLSDRGISNDDTVILYGGNNNWFAAYAYWYFKLYGHDKVKLLDGGRKKWELDGRPLSTDTVSRPATSYTAAPPDNSIRAFRDEVIAAINAKNLVDVRSPDEFSGKILAPAHLPQEQSQRPGHIPGAINVPWSKAAYEDGTFKSDEELAKLYAGAGLDGTRETIAYCRIGERSSHTWFVLQELLGHQNVKNYDGSWTEYGSLVGAPIELGS